MHWFDYEAQAFLPDTGAASVFNLSAAAFRKRISRGDAPGPIERGKWDRHAVWADAVRSHVRDLTEAPIDVWHSILTRNQVPGGFVMREALTSGDTSVIVWQHSNIGHTVALVYSETPSDWKTAVEYRDSSRGTPSVLLPAVLEADAAIVVTYEVSLRMHYACAATNIKTGETFYMGLDEVAALLGGLIPFWPENMRGIASTDLPQRSPVAEPPTVRVVPPSAKRLSDAKTELSARNPRPEKLLEALSGVTEESATEAYESITRTLNKWVGDYLITPGTPRAAEHYLFPVMLPAPPSGHSPVADPREELVRRAWATPVGFSPTLRAAAQVIDWQDISHRAFNADSATDAQLNMMSRARVIPADEITLAHLACTAHGLEREVDAYLTDPVTGTVMVRSSGDRIDYMVPQDTIRTDIVTFDLTDIRNPFGWTSEGEAIPLVAVDWSGFNVGYPGTGPQATTKAVLAHLGLSNGTVSANWPLYASGTRRVFDAAELRALVKN